VVYGTLNMYFAAVIQDNVLDDGQAQTGASASGVADKDSREYGDGATADMRILMSLQLAKVAHDGPQRAEATCS